MAADQRDNALELARLLLAGFPGDDAILELFLEVHFHFGEHEPARALLVQRLQHKFKGTVFLRFQAQLLAADGRIDEAVRILEDVTRREQNLYVNTIAQPQKGLIYEQYQRSQDLLDGFRKQLAEG